MKIIGNLEPNTHLLARVAREGCALNDFWTQADVPSELFILLTQQGYKPTERTGMLFAHNASVGAHTDDELTACWFLSGCDVQYCNGPAHELFVAGKFLKVGDGDVVLFDARKTHGLLACTTNLWSCFSIYVKKIKGKVKQP
jgi:hypothetical protein